MVADLELGNNSLLTTSLTTNDRITITRAANNQQVATMTVAEFMNKCASMMPQVSLSSNGILYNTTFKTLLINKGSVTIDTVDEKIYAGTYSHGSNIVSGGSYGILVVFRAGEYLIQIDYSLNGTTFIRGAHRVETAQEIAWTQWKKIAG